MLRILQIVFILFSHFSKCPKCLLYVFSFGQSFETNKPEDNLIEPFALKI